METKHIVIIVAVLGAILVLPLVVHSMVGKDSTATNRTPASYNIVEDAKSSAAHAPILDALSADLDAAYEELGRPEVSFESMSRVMHKVDLVKHPGEAALSVLPDGVWIWVKVDGVESERMWAPQS